MDASDIMTVEDVAELFHVHKITVYRWIKAGQTPPFRKIGRRFFFRRDEVEEWYDEDGVEESP